MMRAFVIASALALAALSASAQCGGGGGGGGGSDCSGGGYCPPECMSCGPVLYVVINMGTDWRFTGSEDGVDVSLLRGSGKLRAGWTAPNSDIAFLALDKNGNGIIDDGSEIFGNRMTLPNGRVAPNGFAALAEYDSNGDGMIDRRDTVWSKLVLWIDRNHDGVSQPSELLPIAESPVTRLELTRRWSGRTDASGNVFRYESAAHVGNEVRAYYEVSFVTRR